VHNRNRIIQLVAAVMMIVSLVIAGSMMPSIEATSSDAQLKYTTEATEGAPIPVVIAQSIGVLRGIIVNYMWIKADKLKQDGKFYEAYHLSRWITQLQPRFAKVWSFHAWNMAYNISVSTHTKEERWQWVNEGINLIRKYGIKYNPNDMALYKEMAWCFLHKISGFTDDAHNYYKQQLADEWHGLLGEPPFEHQSRIDRIKAVAEAPERLEDIRTDHPEIDALINDLKQVDFKLDYDFLYLNEKLNALHTSYLAQKVNMAEQFGQLAESDDIDPAYREQMLPMVNLKRIRDQKEYEEVWPILINYVRKQVLREEYNMDPMKMYEFTEEFGPLDWRSADAHALYWTAIGVPKGLSRYQQGKFDRINTDRILFHSEQALKRKGSIHYDFITGDLSWGPDLRFIPYYEHVFDIVKEREETLSEYAKTKTFIDGYRNFMIDAVREYYQWGEYEKAGEYYAKLRNDPLVQDPEDIDRFNYPIQQFILRESYDRYDSPDVAVNDVLGLLVSAYRNGLARGNAKGYKDRVKQAKIIYDSFYATYGDFKTLFTDRNRLELLPWTDPTNAQLCMMSWSFAEAMLYPSASIEERMILWERAEDWVKAKTYDGIMNQLYDMYNRISATTRIPIGFNEAFPPPENLDYYRKLRGIETDPSEKDKLQLQRS